MTDHERIYLQPECCGDDEGCGRLWCQDDVFTGECEEGADPTVYVRSDVYDTAIAEIEQLRNYLEIAHSEMAFAVGTIASRNEQNYDYRSKKLAEFCDEVRAFLDGKALQTKITPCIGNDPTCPCQDGDICHYEGPDAWPVTDKDKFQVKDFCGGYEPIDQENTDWCVCGRPQYHPWHELEKDSD